MYMARRLLVAACLLLHLQPGNALANPDLDKLLEKADRFMVEMDEEQALQTYLAVLEADASNYEALWNASLLYATIGFRFEDKPSQTEYFEQAKALAGKSLARYPDKGHPYFVMAIAKGRMADLVGVQRRIQLGHEIEEHIKQAIDRMPDHAPSWHLYGIWQSEVANVSRLERVAARLVSRGLPGGSNEKAEEFLKKAIELDPESIMIRLDLAHHYVRSGQQERAIAVLEKLLELDLPITWKDDPEHLKTARTLREDLR